MNGTQYANWVGQYIKSNFSTRGISVFTEVYMGKSIIGKNRRVDILVLDAASNKAVSFECKYQNVSGTADEKVPYTLQDAAAMQMDSYVVYGGGGFSQGITHMLEASEYACCAMPNNGDKDNFSRTATTKELDQLLAMRFSWWDIFTQNKTAL